jgi:transcriptional regulator GlxA family with amidase domain
MSTVQEIENAINHLSLEDMRLVRDWLENQLEDKLHLTDEFKGRIENSERQMARLFRQ